MFQSSKKEKTPEELKNKRLALETLNFGISWLNFLISHLLPNTIKEITRDPKRRFRIVMLWERQKKECWRSFWYVILYVRGPHCFCINNDDRKLTLIHRPVVWRFSYMNVSCMYIHIKCLFMVLWWDHITKLQKIKPNQDAKPEIHVINMYVFLLFVLMLYVSVANKKRNGLSLCYGNHLFHFPCFLVSRS